MCVFSWASAWGGQGQPHTLFLSILIQDLLLGPGTHWLGRMSCHWTSKYCCPHLSSTGWQAYNIWVLMWVLKINWGPFACKVSTQPRYLLSYSMSSATSIISPNTLLGFCSYIWVVGIQLYEFWKFQGKIIWGKSSLTNFVHNGMTRERLASSSAPSLRSCHARVCRALLKGESATKIQEMCLLGLHCEYTWVWTQKPLQFWRDLLRVGTILYFVAGYKGSPSNSFNF